MLASLRPCPSIRQFCCRRAVLQQPRITSTRFFSSVPSVSRAVGKNAVPRAADAPGAAFRQSRYAFLKNLAAKPTPTTLYEAPSHFWFYWGCWSGGMMLISWSALTGPSSMQQLGETPIWVATVFGAAYLLLTAGGFWLISKTNGIVSTIRILPSQTARRVAGPTTAPSLQMEFTVKRMLPVLSPKVISAPLDKVTLDRRVSLPGGYLSPAEVQAREREDKARRVELHKHDMNHLLTMPFRRMGRGFKSLYRESARVWTDSGFGSMEVNGKKYKLDVMNGYSHDSFRTLEAVIMKDK